MEVPPIPKAPSPEALEQRTSPVAQEPTLPKGRPLSSVHAHPTPVVGGPQPMGSEPTAASERLRSVQARSDITGTGGIIDTWA